MNADFSKGRMPSFWTIQLIGWIVYLATIYITFLTIAPPERFLSLFYLKGFRALTGFVLTSVFLRPIYESLASRLSITPLIVLVLVAASIFGLVWTAIEGVFVYLTSFPFDLGNYLARSPRIALDYAMTLTAWSAIYLGAKNWLAWQAERENSLQASVLANQAQIEMLRYQINPHFLFNALNSIRASVDENADRAKEMITQMSEFLRYSLLAETRKKIPLSEEIEAVRNYLAIEKIRFEDEISVRFEIQDDAETFEVPCFLLTPLVDNAVKHGHRTKTQPLQIAISAGVRDGRVSLEVRNSGQFRKTSGENGTGIGLKNVAERLSGLYGDHATFEIGQSGDMVSARIGIFDETQGDNNR